MAGKAVRLLRDDLVKPDLLSELLLTISGVVLCMPLLLIAVCALKELAAR